jgi:hypothetical protein
VSSTEDIYDLEPDEPAAALPRPPTRQAYEAQRQGPTRCVNCGYDLRGLRMVKCPECGVSLTSRTFDRVERRQDTLREVYLQPLIYLGAGLGISLAVTLLFGGVGGVAAMLMYFGLSIVVGWVVFTAMSLLWIGFDQPLLTTALQLAAAYAASFGVTLGLGAIMPVVGWIGGIVVLIGLLIHFLEIEPVEAVAVAVVSFGIKILAVFLLSP